MQTAIRILAILFAIVAVLAATSGVILIAGFFTQGGPAHRLPQKQFAMVFAGVMYCSIFLAIYAVLSWLLWLRIYRKKAMLYAVGAVLGFMGFTISLEAGAILGLITLVLLTRPSAKALFSS